MKKKLIPVLLVSGLLLGGVAAWGVAGSLQDPMVSLEYLKGTFQTAVRSEIGQKAESSVSASYQSVQKKLDQIAEETRTRLSSTAASGDGSYYANFTRMTLAFGDTLVLSTGAGLFFSEGSVEAVAQGGELVDVTAGTAAASLYLIPNHRYLVGEGATVTLTVQSEAAVLSPVAQVKKTASGQTALPFTDITRNDWYYAAVSYAVQEKLFNGVTETQFAPNSTVTRAMLATVLYRLAGEPDESGSGVQFSDVPSDSWYASGVSWAAQTGIVKGMGDGLFLPNANVSREQLAVMLYRYADEYAHIQTDAVGDLSTFMDETQISDWAVDGLAWAVGEEILKGNTDAKLNPAASASRAETATMLQRFATLLS